MRRLVVVAALAGALLAAAPPAGARVADGDPASDVLLFDDVFLPAGARRVDLARAVAQVYAGGNRVKVAVIATPTDLGAVPSLFGHPQEYAHFLGLELGSVYVGPLLVVMPAGFGIYDGGRSTAAEQRVLDGAGSPGSPLVDAATRIVEALDAAGALRSRDILRPVALPLPVLARRGVRVALKYTVSEDSERSRELVQVRRGRQLVASLRHPFHEVHPGKTAYVVWRVPPTLKPGQLRVCVTAWDRAGNRSRPGCSTVRVV